MNSIKKRFNNGIFVFLGLLLNTSLFAQSFKPSDLPGLRLWLAADTNVILTSGKVSMWDDLSGYSFLANQTTASMRPIKVDNVICGKPVIRFDGIDDFLRVNFGQTFSQSKTIFIVKNSQSNGTITIDGIDVSNRNVIQDINNKAGINAGVNLEYTKPAPYSFSVFTGVYNGANSKIYENSILKVAGDAGTQNLTGLSIGSSYLNTQNFQGDIAEIIFFNSLLADSNRIKVENYLMNKYAPPINLGPDIYVNYFCDTVIHAPACLCSVLWSNGSTANSITVNQEGSYIAWATNCFGYTSSDTVNVFYPNHHINDTLICYGDTVTVSLGLTGSYNYLWNTASTTEAINIWQPGLYWVRATDNLGCYKTDTFNVTVDSLAYYVSLGSDTFNLCVGNTIGLASGSNFVDNYLWSPGGETTPVISISNSGWYSVLASDNFGCSRKDSAYVGVIGTAPVPDFSITHFCTNDTVHFQDLSMGIDGVSNWEWLIVGHDTSYLQNPVFIFDTAGIYTLNLTVGSLTGCSKDTVAHFTIHPSPVVNLGDDILACQFYNFWLNAGPGFSSYQWFNNSTTQSIYISTINYGIGSFNAWVTVSNIYGCLASDTIAITIETCPGIDETTSNGIHIYPNPSNGILHIELGCNFNNNCDVFVYNIQGQLVKTQNEINTNAFKLDLSKQSKGIYFMKMISGEFISVYKIVLN